MPFFTPIACRPLAALSASAADLPIAHGRAHEIGGAGAAIVTHRAVEHIRQRLALERCEPVDVFRVGPQPLIIVPDLGLGRARKSVERCLCHLYPPIRRTFYSGLRAFEPGGVGADGRCGHFASTRATRRSLPSAARARHIAQSPAVCDCIMSSSAVHDSADYAQTSRPPRSNLLAYLAVGDDGEKRGAAENIADQRRQNG